MQSTLCTLISDLTEITAFISTPLNRRRCISATKIIDYRFKGAVACNLEKHVYLVNNPDKQVAYPCAIEHLDDPWFFFFFDKTEHKTSAKIFLGYDSNPYLNMMPPAWLDLPKITSCSVQVTGETQDRLAIGLGLEEAGLGFLYKIDVHYSYEH